MVLWRDGALGFYILLLTDQVSIFSSIKSLCSALFYIFSIWHSAVLLYELYFLLFKVDDKVMAFRELKRHILRPCQTSTMKLFLEIINS